jgi:hypothetical protein
MWLAKQPAETRLRILAAEREYVERRAPQLAALDDVAYQQSCGFEDRAAGARPRELFSGQGDWSWQPQRFKQDPGYTFTRDDLVMVNLDWPCGEIVDRTAELEAQMPTYKPPRHPLSGVRPGI